MADLSPKARTLIREGRDAFCASAGDRARVDAALRARLGAEALPPIAGLAQASGHWQIVALGVCVLGGAAFWALQPSQHARTLPAVSNWQAPQPKAAAPAQPLTTSPTQDAARSRPSSAASPAREREELAREVALLARATKELRAGETRKALNTLETHQRNFPNGALAEERRSATAQALCALGRVLEGRAEQALLAPSSPAASRAKQVCDMAADHK